MVLHKKPLLFTFLFFFSQVVFAQIGVVFILGKGPASRDAHFYWGDEMVQILTKNEKLPYLLANYNGGLELNEASKVVGKQIYEFIENPNNSITELKVVTHSYGGVVIRAIVSKYLESDQFEAIARLKPTIYAIAAPNAGSAAADLAYNLKGKLIAEDIVQWLGHNSKATFDLTKRKMQQVNKDILFGTKGRPPLPFGIEYHTIVGTKALHSWYRKVDVALGLLASLSDLPKPNDGMVDKSSGQAVGIPFAKVSSVEANHAYNRRNQKDKFAAEIAAMY